MNIVRYMCEHQEVWNRFVAESKNAFFMFDRRYMDYHADRFQDHSLLCYEGEDLVAVLPANENEGVLYSHQGLTFGGFITGKSMKAAVMLDVFEAVLAYLKALGFIRMEYKAIPYIYHAYPAQEDLYALFRHNALIIRVDASTSIALETPYPLNKGKKAAISKAKRLGIRVEESKDFDAYFEILNGRLEERYKKQSTHTAEEMRLLCGNFPDNIKLFAAFEGDTMISGVLVYLSQQVVHTQYIGASPRGLEVGSNDLIISHVLETYREGRKFFDFGISNENRGMFLNFGLIAQKEHFGGRMVVHQFFALNV